MNISAVKARNNFGELLNRVLLTDEEITIERLGKEVAKLIKVGTQPKAEKNRENLILEKAEA